MMIVAAALIAATAALVTAAVAFSGFLISKDLKTTEFRQVWISDQRADLAILIAEAQTIARLPQDQQGAASLRVFDEAAVRVALRENPTKKEWERPLDLIADLRVALSGGTATLTTAQRLVSDVTSEAQNLLKIEWDRVRAGEETYQKARRFVIWSAGRPRCSSSGCFGRLATGRASSSSADARPHGRKPIITLPACQPARANGLSNGLI